MNNTLAVRFDITEIQFTRTVIHAHMAGWNMIENFTENDEAEKYAVFARWNGDTFYLYKDENTCSVSAIADKELNTFEALLSWVGNK